MIRSAVPDATKLIGQSPHLQHVRTRIHQIAHAPVPVLILGETGTGKEVCAEAIMQLSGRRPFVAVNCAAFTESLIESELFGHRKGAFTGASHDRRGLIAEADGGSLFLDELAELPAGVQARLLRTLESGEYRPLGSNMTLRSNFRLLAATNGDVEKLRDEGRLRADLLHRLGALRIFLPPLRERREDIGPIAAHLLDQYRRRVAYGPTCLSPLAVEMLSGKPWPGNVRELRNVIEASAALANGSDILHAEHVSDVMSGGRALNAGTECLNGLPTLAEALLRAEGCALNEALQHSGGNREQAARLLGISEATLYRKLSRVQGGRAGRSVGHRNDRSRY